MPIYEYLCARCRHPFEVLVRSARQRISCPGCGSKKVTKLLSSFGVNLGASSAGRSRKGCTPKPGG